MKIELDIDKIVSDAITTALDPERLQKLIETQVTKVADSAIGSVFSDYGDFGKTVKKAVAELVPHDLALDKQTDWNHYVTTVMNQRLAALISRPPMASHTLLRRLEASYTARLLKLEAAETRILELENRVAVLKSENRLLKAKARNSKP